MSPPELGFLALGLALGTTVGAALMVAVRLRSPMDRVVRITLTPNAITPRAAGGGGTVSATRLGGPLPGSPDAAARLNLGGGRPADAISAALASPPESAPTRTRVSSGNLGPDPAPVGIRPARDVAATAGAVDPAGTAVAVAERPAEAAAIAFVVEPAPATAAAPTRGAGAVPTLSRDAIAIPISAARAARSGGAARPGAASGRGALPMQADPCADDRGRTEAACAAAESAREDARIAADRLRDARRVHDALQASVDEAAMLADGRRLAAEKERLHDEFRSVHRSTASADEAEAAARAWLTAVSAANGEAMDAARRVHAGTQQLREQAPALERLDLEASAARIRAERAGEECRGARERLAACEELQRRAPEPEPPRPSDQHWPPDQEPAFDRRVGGVGELDRLPVIVHVLRGDAGAREHLVAALAEGDPAATAAWHLRVADFVDAVTARAIEDGFLDLPEQGPFWRLFSEQEQRDIVRALAALGFRFDGLQGFADDRVPSARDLSLAVGYAGLDPMRIRAWPGEAELPGLYRGATVRADLWLATQADDLSLARVEASLGARADGLAEMWGAWGRIRPVMLEDR